MLNVVSARVNAVLDRALPLRSDTLPEADVRQRATICSGRFRPEPPHVRTTAAVGRFSIVRTEHKGKINKRLYIRLDHPTPPAAAR